MKKRFLIALVSLILLSTYKLQNNPSHYLKLNIEKIYIQNNLIVKKEKIMDKLNFLYKTNLFLLNTSSLGDKLSEIELIESFEIKKIYPNSIQVTIYEKEPVAILQNKKQKKYFTSNGSIVKFQNLERFKHLPVVFGDHKSFKNFYDDLISINFPIDQIQKYYLFETKRWDLITNKKQTIKLPTKNYMKSLKNFMEIKNQTSFKKYKIFDYRINNQLILK